MSITLKDTTPRGGGLPKKKCPKCLETKLAEKFYKNPRTRDGLFYCCKECWNGSRRDKYSTDEEWAQSRREYAVSKYATDDDFRYKKKSVVKLRDMRNRALNYGCDIYVLPEDPWAVLYAQYGAVCMVKGCPETNPAIDHIIPLNQQGDHGLHNMQLLCASHNSRKGRNGTDDYRPYVAVFDEQYRQLDSNIDVKGSGSPVDGLLGQDPLQITTNNTEGLESEIDKETK